MTTNTTNTPFTTSQLRARVDAVLTGIGQGFNAYIERESRMAQMQALNAKTDEELKAMGLTRDAIPRHVFCDIFYI